MTDMEDDYDAGASHEDIDANLQQWIRALLSTARNAPAGESRDGGISLEALDDIGFFDIKNLVRPVHLLSGICRLLIKKGDTLSFQRCFRLAHLIYAFKCTKNESWYVFYLYKGVAQVGLGLHDVGIANILFAVAGQAAYRLHPADRALGAWAIASAAIASRNIRMAQEFAAEWRRCAAEAGSAAEVLRAGLGRHLLNLVVGDPRSCRQTLPEIEGAAPGGWAPAVAYLKAWTDALLENVCPQEIGEAVKTPLPLWVGLEWRPTADLASAENAGDFAFICALCRRFCNVDAIRSLPPDRLERYAEHLARWELAYPLRAFEGILKQHADRYHQFAMTRFLGKYRIESLLKRQMPSPEIVMEREAVLLVMDIRGFSTMCERHEPQKVFRLINPLFKIVNEELEGAGGTVLEFEGDCMIVIFNVEPEKTAEFLGIVRHAAAAVRRLNTHSALAMQSGAPELRVGMGIARGVVALGYVGGLSRCHMTVIGNAINLASRIESETKQSPSPILVSEACFPSARPDVWEDPLAVNFSLRNLFERRIKNMRPVRLFGVAPLIRYRVDFMPMGFVATAEPGVVYLDSGNAATFGIVDHHAGDTGADSSCELLVTAPHLLLGHLQEVPESLRAFRMHAEPDMDCAASLYAACELLAGPPFVRTALLEELARYVSRIDQGAIPDPDHLGDSLYGVFMAHQSLAWEHCENAEKAPADHRNLVLLEAGLRVVDAAMHLMEEARATGFSNVFSFRPDWFPAERELIRKDFDAYKRDHPTGGGEREFRARVNVTGGGDRRKVAGVWLERPRSRFFKHWARNDRRAPGGKGYELMVVDWSKDAKNRFVISVDPESGFDLKGLGETLEKAETKQRIRLRRPRPPEPRRWPADNADPWYFGQGHNYTIVDAPHRGTVLDKKTVREIVENW